MLSVHLAFINEQTRRTLSRVLLSAGMPLGEMHGAGAPVIRAVRQRGGGLVLCGERLSDMTAFHLHHALGEEALVVVLGKENADLSGDGGLVRLALPLSPVELAARLRTLLQGEEARQRARRGTRTPGEQELIQKAKDRLSSRLGINENTAHRLLQQMSMREGLRMACAAQKILDAGERN
jgi:response regulator NasT